MASPCIVCASSDSTIFHVVNGFAIRTCSGCSLRFLDPQPTSADLDRLYGENYFAKPAVGEPGYDRYLEEIEQLRRMFEHRLDLLPSPTGSPTLLDVGAAAGVFVERARARGWDATGVEPSSWASAYARETLQQPVTTGTLATLALPTESLDAVTMWEVIEHLPDPAAELAEIRRVLRPGGHLALSTPDARSLVTRTLGKRWPGWSKVPEHLFFFDRPTLFRLLRQSGFRVTVSRYVPLFVSFGYLVDRGREVARVAWRPPIPEAIARRSVRVNPGFDLFVLAVAE